MYSLMLVLSLLATAAFLHVFAFGRRRYLPLFVILLAALLYTHNWGLFLGVGARPWDCPLLVRVRGPARASGGRAARLRRGRPALPALGSHASPPGAAHRRALAQPAATSARPCRSRRRCSAAARRPWRSCSRAAPGMAADPGPPGGGQGAHGAARRRGDRARHAARGLARLPGLARVDHALPRRAARPDAAPRRARPGTRGDPRPGGARDHHRDLGDPQELRAQEQVERLGPARQRGVQNFARATSCCRCSPSRSRCSRYHLEHLGGAPELRYGNPMGAVENDRVMDWTTPTTSSRTATPSKNLEPLLASLPRGGRVLIVHPVTSSVRTTGTRPGRSSSGAGPPNGARRSRPIQRLERVAASGAGPFPAPTAEPPASECAACMYEKTG